MNFSLVSNCKINIGLNVTGKLENGYHLLDMIMVPISLADKITGKIYPHEGELQISTNLDDIPTDKRNILYKIYDKFYEKSGLKKPKIEVYLEKKVPHEAGLGGGSSNGAFFLKLLNEYHDNYFSMDELIKIGKSIGADIPFFLLNKSARVKGIGEVLEPIKNNLKNKVIIIKPEFGVSTAVAYKNVYMNKNKKDANIDNIIEGLKNNDLKLIENSIENNLEQGLLLEDENIISFRKHLSSISGYKFYMSGSGSAYFTFVDTEDAEKKIEVLSSFLSGCKVYLCDLLENI